MAHSHDRVVAAYLTDDFVEERIDVMQLWGDFLTDPMEPVINATPSEKGGTRPKIKSKDEPATGTAPDAIAMQYQVRTSQQGNQKMERLLPLLGELQNAAIQPKRWPR